MNVAKDSKLKFYFYLCATIHLCSVLTAMTLTSRMIEVNIDFIGYRFNTTGGVFLIPLAFFIQDIITEIYGFNNAKKVLIASLTIFILYVLSLYVLTLIPCNSTNKSCSMLSTIASTLPRHALSFVISLGIGGTLNNYILSKLKLTFNGRFLAMRFISSTAIGELCFQLIAVAISWAGIYSVWEIIPLAVISYMYKLVFEIISTPINIYACRYLKIIQQREENYALR